MVGKSALTEDATLVLVKILQGQLVSDIRVEVRRRVLECASFPLAHERFLILVGDEVTAGGVVVYP
jgi:hypothetical protein